MNINGIGTTGYPAWQSARKAQQNMAGKSFVAQVNNVAGTPKVYNIFSDEDMLWTGGNGTGLSYYLKYAEDSTEDDPKIIAKGVDENGDEFEKTIHINEINPKSATVVEMRALEAHMGVKKLGGFTSLPMEAGAMGLNDRTDFGYVPETDWRHEAVAPEKDSGILPVQYAGVLGFHEQEINSAGYISPVSNKGRHP